ncbi:hypothetical protein P3T76_008112 [Phytophthora citrophthora]|uniref:Uncharacterized protein n=1 Tax=Phytophthora citrophthora TaxID=4793 RepID=A0AAD9GLK0_9STRA|nr:hypothetical protein P3T76_008112 [Phytophthora citrophthora]
MASKHELSPRSTTAHKKTSTNSKDMDKLPTATRILIETLKEQIKTLQAEVKEERARGEKAVREERDRAEAREKRFERVIKHGLDRACSTIKYLSDNATKAQVEATPLLHRTSTTLEDNQRHNCKAYHGL